MRDSFIIYRSFYEALVDLDDNQQAEIFRAMCEYSLNGEDVELTGITKAMFKLIKPQLEANNKRHENGKRPKTQQNESKPQAKPKQSESKPQANHKQTTSKPEANENENVNVNENENENVNEKDQSEKISLTLTKKENHFNFKKFTKSELMDEAAAKISEVPQMTSGDLIDFVEYWSELSARGQPRAALEKTWDTAGRMRNWIRRKYEFNKGGSYSQGVVKVVDQFS
jgi:hypothetical protein